MRIESLCMSDQQLTEYDELCRLEHPRRCERLYGMLPEDQWYVRSLREWYGPDYEVELASYVRSMSMLIPGRKW